MRRQLISTVVLAAALAAPAAASANFFAGDPIDASPGIQSVGDLDLARDGTGAVAYVRQDGGVDHVFVARFSGGRFAAPERVDASLPGASSQPVVGASDDGRLLVAFVNGGTVYGVVKPSGANPVAAPVPLGAGDNPAADLSINGTGFVAFTGGADVRVARLDRRTNAFALLPAVLDANPAAPAGIGTGRPRVSVSADGIGVVVWGESGHVYARKMFNTGLSNAPQDLSTPSIEGRVPTTSELPDIDAEDDSSFAWAVFRQNFADGGSRVLARRQRGTQFDPPVPVDAGDEATTAPRIEINGRGVGLATAAGTGTNQPIVNVLEDDKLTAGVRMGGIGVTAPRQAPVAAENNDALIAAIIGPGGGAPFVRLRPFDDGKSQPEVTLSKAELGAVDPNAGFDAASDRAFGVVVTWVQGGRLVAGFLDRGPLTFAGFTSQRCCRPAAPRLNWAAAFDLWGPISYDVLVDNKPVGRTTATGLQLAKPLTGGTHRWHVVATDIRGQQTRSRTRLLRVDGLRPRQTIRYRRSGRTVTLSVRGRDVKRKGQRSSGIGSVRVAWGDGARTSGRSRVSARHRYRRSGSFALVVTTRDKAGNQVVRRRTVRIGG